MVLEHERRDGHYCDPPDGSVGIVCEFAGRAHVFKPVRSSELAYGLTGGAVMAGIPKE